MAGGNKPPLIGDVVGAAREYIRRGFAPIPIPRRKKAPRLKNWQNLRLSEAECAAYFPNGVNIGLLLGEPSGGLADVDLDALQAASIAPTFFPPTQMVHGRKGKPKSHWWYACPPPPKSEKFSDVDGTCVLELRSTGQQTLAPPSIHPSGEQLRWERTGEPAKVSAADLRGAVARTAAAALLARHWPAVGNRHEAALSLAGLLLRAGWSEEEGRTFISAVATAAHDEEGRSRAAGVLSTARRLASNAVATGRPRLAELLGEEVIARVCKWVEIGPPGRATGGAGPYRVEAGRICIQLMKEHGVVSKPLCNFAARVVEELVVDDGAEPTRAFVVEGMLDTGEKLPQARVPASRFAGLSWVAEHWGLSAIVNAGLATRDQLREAIQRLSPNPRRRLVFAHSGWRQIGDQWVFLTSSGAVGSDGFEVDLGPELRRYSLPCTPEDPRGAMQLSLRLLDIGPLMVMAALWAGIFRAPLAGAYPVDLSLWLEGPTGSLKSTIAALFLSHLGLFDRTSLPGTWASTANQLERRAFTLKDLPFVVDDYAPSALDSRDLESKAMRLLRAQGNLAGRGRLRADLTERPAYPPRGFIISTGEQHPPGQSLLARMLVVEVDHSMVNVAALTQAQATASRLPHAMAGYVMWLAPQIPNLPKLLRETFEGARAHATADGEHLRVPEALAHLWIGLHCGLTYAEEVRACSHAEAEERGAQCWHALLLLGRAQGRLIEGERPSRRFLSVLAALVAQKRAVVLPRERAPDSYHGDAQLLGWFDEERVYLIPEAAIAVVVKFCREAGEPFPVRAERLLRDLNRECLSESHTGRHTLVARVGGRSHRVLCLLRGRVERLLGQDILCGVTDVTGVTASEE